MCGGKGGRVEPIEGSKGSTWSLAGADGSPVGFCALSKTFALGGGDGGSGGSSCKGKVAIATDIRNETAGVCVVNGDEYGRRELRSWEDGTRASRY